MSDENPELDLQICISDARFSFVVSEVHIPEGTSDDESDLMIVAALREAADDMEAAVEVPDAEA